MSYKKTCLRDFILPWSVNTVSLHMIVEPTSMSPKHDHGKIDINFFGSFDRTHTCSVPLYNGTHIKRYLNQAIFKQVVKILLRLLEVNNEIYGLLIRLPPSHKTERFHCISDDGYFAEDFANFSVTVSNEAYPVTYDQLKQTTFSTCGQHDGRVPPAEFGRVTCSPNPARGRYVYISLPDANLLVLCEVRVCGGKFGISHGHTVDFCNLFANVL